MNRNVRKKTDEMPHKKKTYVARICMICMLLASVMVTGGCSAAKEAENATGDAAVTTEAGESADADTQSAAGGIEQESGADGSIDFEMLTQINPEIWGWLYIPGTNIDRPLLKSTVSDDYYADHTADGTEGEEGALYIEIPNQTNLCDFNTVIHGKDQQEDDLFYELHKFDDPDFFAQNEQLYIYTPDNVYTYEIFGACYDEGSDILRRYDYTTEQGCNAYLSDFYSRRDLSMNKREGWEDLTAANFLLTLDGTTADDKQFVVLAVLIDAGEAHMGRVIYDENDPDIHLEDVQ